MYRGTGCPTDDRASKAEANATIGALDPEEARQLLQDHAKKCPVLRASLRLARAEGFEEAVVRALEVDDAAGLGSYGTTNKIIRDMRKAVERKERIPEVIKAYERIALSLIERAHNARMRVTDHYETRDLCWKIEGLHRDACSLAPPGQEELAAFLVHACGWGLFVDAYSDYRDLLTAEGIEAVHEAQGHA